MRPLLALAVLAFAGCAAVPPVEAPVADVVGLLCADPCEAALDDGPGRAFEPTIAVDPSDPDHIVAVASEMAEGPDGQEHRWNKAYVSFDGGAAWTTVRMPGGPEAGPDHPLFACTDLGDAIVAILNDGTVLVGGIALTNAAETGLPFVGAAGSGMAVWVARSSDGGLTYPDVQVLAAPEGGVRGCAGDPEAPRPQAFSNKDKPALAVAPDGSVLFAWTDIRAPPSDEPGRFSRLDTMLVVSEDGGRTWSGPRLVHASDSGEVVEGPAFAFTADGRWHVALLDLVDADVLYGSSSDEGATWDVGTLAPASHSFPAFGAHGDALRLAYAHEDGRSVALLASADAGATWDEPLVLDTGAAEGTVTPALSVGPDGTTWVAYYRPLAEDANEFRVAAVAADGAVLGPVTVSETAVGRQTLGLALGHYMGVAARLDGALPVWVSGDVPATDLRLARVTLI